MRKDFYVYILCRKNGAPFYVGKGSGDRWLDHERQRTGKHNPLLRGTLKQENYVFPKFKIAENLTEEDAWLIEMALIEALGRRCVGTGILTNITVGGEGATGTIWSQESRAKASASAKLRKASIATRAKISARHKGKKLSAEHKAKLSALKKGVPVHPVGSKLSEAHKAAISAGKKGRTNGLEGKQLSEEHRAKLSAARRAVIERKRAAGVPDLSGRGRRAKYEREMAERQL